MWPARGWYPGGSTSCTFPALLPHSTSTVCEELHFHTHIQLTHTLKSETWTTELGKWECLPNLANTSSWDFLLSQPSQIEPQLHTHRYACVHAHTNTHAHNFNHQSTFQSLLLKSELALSGPVQLSSTYKSHTDQDPGRECHPLVPHQLLRSNSWIHLDPTLSGKRSPCHSDSE